MNAQDEWKSAYKRYKQCRDDIRFIEFALHDMNRYIREAALERKLAAAERRIAELEAMCDLYGRDLLDSGALWVKT